MKKIAFLIILILVLATSIVKNSTKEIEDKIFVLKENIRPLKTELGEALLEYNFLSSPEKLTQYQNQYFEKDLIKINITQIKELRENNDQIVTNSLIKDKNGLINLSSNISFSISFMLFISFTCMTLIPVSANRFSISLSTSPYCKLINLTFLEYKLVAR